MGDASPKSKNKQKQQDDTKKKANAATAAAKQPTATPGVPGKKSGR